MAGYVARTVLAVAAAWLAVAPAAVRAADPPDGGDGAQRAATMADFFSQVGDQIYEDCIFELSEEQIEVQEALIKAYINLGASSGAARRMAASQIKPPPLSQRCEDVKRQNGPQLPQVPDLPGWSTTTAAPQPPQAPAVPRSLPPAPPSLTRPEPYSMSTALASKRVLPEWDCGPGVDYVTIHHKGFERKLSGGEICNPFEDVVRQVPDSAKAFRLGYVIKTGRLFVVSDNPQVAGKSIAWAISGREVCRNNPDPDCLAARSVGPLPPGEYDFASKKGERVTWGPTINRMVVGIYLNKLWNRERYTPEQTKAILARGNIAIHVRLKGEMSEACLGLGPAGWAYVSSLIRDGRAVGLNVYVDEPYPLVAETPPILKASGFSLTSLFK